MITYFFAWILDVIFCTLARLCIAYGVKDPDARFVPIIGGLAFMIVNFVYIYIFGEWMSMAQHAMDGNFLYLAFDFNAYKKLVRMFK